MKKELAALLTVGAVMVSGGGTALAAEVAPNGQSMVSNSGFLGPVMRLEDLAFEALDSDQIDEALFVQTRATESLSCTISAGKTAKASTAFPMESGETVTINCAYSPSSATVDFGLIAPDNKFYYLSGENGSINKLDMR